MVLIDRYQKKTMQRLLPAILLCAGLQSASAVATTVLTPVARQPDAILQAQLAVPADPAERGHVAVQAVKAQAKPPGAATADPEGQDRPFGMLLAAVALITGVAMRRWGMGQQ